MKDNSLEQLIRMNELFFLQSWLMETLLSLDEIESYYSSHNKEVTNKFKNIRSYMRNCLHRVNSIKRFIFTGELIEKDKD